MKNKVKFMLIGAVMTGMFSMAHAHEQKPISETQIKESISSILQKQIDKGLFSEHSDISIQIKKTEKSSKNEESHLIENDLERVGNICKMRLTFDEKGNIPFLGKGDEIKIATQLKNERQKEIARQFVALHEQSHCEFSAIENPIKIKGESHEYEQKMGHYLKDLDALYLGFGESTKLSYIKTINESYADVSAMVALIKEYGKDDKDLQYVLKSIGTQRHEAYLNVGAESHDTHVAIRKLLTSENLSKIDSINTQKEFRDFVLTIANDGVQTLLTQRPEFAKESLTKENLDISIVTHMMRIIKHETLDNKKGSPSVFKDGVENGLSFLLAKEILKDVDYSKYNFDESKKVEGKINKEIYYFAVESFDKFEKTNQSQLKEDYNNFRKEMANFIEIINKNNANQVIDFDNKTTKEEIVKKVNMLRNQFLESSKTNSYEFKGLK